MWRTACWSLPSLLTRFPVALAYRWDGHQVQEPRSGRYVGMGTRQPVAYDPSSIDQLWFYAGAAAVRWSLGRLRSCCSANRGIQCRPRKYDGFPCSGRTRGSRLYACHCWPGYSEWRAKSWRRDGTHRLSDSAGDAETCFKRACILPRSYRRRHLWLAGRGGTRGWGCRGNGECTGCHRCADTGWFGCTRWWDQRYFQSCF